MGSNLVLRFSGMLCTDSPILPIGTRERDLQVALDALSLRQQVAEAVVRIWSTALERRNKIEPYTSFWVDLASDKRNNAGVIRNIQSRSAADSENDQLGLLLPTELQNWYDKDLDFQEQVGVMASWLPRAGLLLMRPDIRYTAAHNKAKHGLAVVSQDNELFRAILSQPNIVDGKLSINTLDNSVRILDDIFVKYVDRPPKVNSVEQGLELTYLVLDTATLLVESRMLATLHGAIFHTAASRYVSENSRDIEIAPFPELPFGPTPDELLGKELSGLRFPITTDTDGNIDRPSGFGFNDGTFLPVWFDYDNRQKVTLTDGPSAEN